MLAKVLVPPPTAGARSRICPVMGDASFQKKSNAACCISSINCSPLPSYGFADELVLVPAFLVRPLHDAAIPTPNSGTAAVAFAASISHSRRVFFPLIQSSASAPVSLQKRRRNLFRRRGGLLRLHNCPVRRKTERPT